MRDLRDVSFEVNHNEVFLLMLHDETAATLNTPMLKPLNYETMSILNFQRQDMMHIYDVNQHLFETLD